MSVVRVMSPPAVVKVLRVDASLPRPCGPSDDLPSSPNRSPGSGKPVRSVGAEVCGLGMAPFSSRGLPLGNFAAAVPDRGAEPFSQLPGGTPMAEFSLQLTDDQIQVQEWIHGFAADVLRSYGQEWYDCAEFSWPLLQGAARIGPLGSAHI